MVKKREINFFKSALSCVTLTQQLLTLAPHFHPDPAGSFSCHYANNQNNVKMMTDVIKALP